MGYKFVPMPFSGTPDIVRLDELGGSGGKPTPGHFVNRIDDWAITRGGCLSKLDDNTDPTSESKSP